jgi:predicted nucleotidyltransferase
MSMARTASDITLQEWKNYRPAEAIESRLRANKAQIAKRRRQAWRLARRAANVLRTGFGAEKVIVFGSLARRDWFTPWSDIDLAVWGVPPTRFYEAVDTVVGLSADFKIDLIDPESCRPGLREAIDREGIAL